MKIVVITNLSFQLLLKISAFEMTCQNTFNALKLTMKTETLFRFYLIGQILAHFVIGHKTIRGSKKLD